MTGEEQKRLVRKVVEEAQRFKDAHTTETAAPVNYACIFSHPPLDQQLGLA